MIDLQKISGLPIELMDNYYLKFNPPLVHAEPTVRKFDEMRPVLFNPDTPKPMDEMYYMYRDVHLPEHEEILKKNNTRFDITVIPACLIGREYNKTIGHYHPKNNKGMPYPEVYEVLFGKALFLIQKMDSDYQSLITVIAIEAKAGEKVIYPPGYGHAIINIGVDTLVTANWVAGNFTSIYEPIAKRHGMAYYVFAEGTGEYTFAPNANYPNPPPVRMITSKFMQSFPIVGSDPMYNIGTNNPQSLEFLNFPEKYAVELSSITS
jgi:glucose-6-phosphate isomerase